MLVWREAIPANTAVTPLTTMLDQPTRLGRAASVAHRSDYR